MLAVLAMLTLWAHLSSRHEPVSATVTGLTGETRVLRADAGSELLYPGDRVVIQRGDTLDTGSTGEVEIALGESTAFVASNSLLRVLELQRAGLPTRLVLEMSLERGEMDAELQGLGRGGALLLNAGTVTIRGAQFRCVVTEGVGTTVQAYGQTLLVQQEQYRVRLRSGQWLEARPGEPLAVEGEPAEGQDKTRVPRVTRGPADDLEQTLFPAAAPTETPLLPDTYLVQPGDTLYSIAAARGLAWETLWEANRDLVSSPELLRPGQEIRIPRP
ncbi:MAG: LysM peptidoglycan-binding domain-containing protein [Anaerolineae bacterium]|nr:LysM peptidoglycan-binding domain-containing protein [Chloroflexota bacterium]